MRRSSFGLANLHGHRERLSERFANSLASKVDYKARVKVRNRFRRIAARVADNSRAHDEIITSVVYVAVNPGSRLVSRNVRFKIRDRARR